MYVHVQYFYCSMLLKKYKKVFHSSTVELPTIKCKIRSREIKMQETGKNLHFSKKRLFYFNIFYQESFRSLKIYYTIVNV